MLNQENTIKLDKQLASLGRFVFDYGNRGNREHLDRDIKNNYGIVIGKYDELWRLYSDGALLQRNGWQLHDELDLDVVKRELERVNAKIRMKPVRNPNTVSEWQERCAQQ